MIVVAGWFCNRNEQCILNKDLFYLTIKNCTNCRFSRRRVNKSIGSSISVSIQGFPCFIGLNNCADRAKNNSKT